jgi:hypothetical protein
VHSRELIPVDGTVAPLETIGLFGFAWTSLGPPHVHWIAPMIFSALVGIANYAIYMGTIDYMIAAYGPVSRFRDCPDTVPRADASTQPAHVEAMDSLATFWPESRRYTRRLSTRTWAELLIDFISNGRPQFSPSLLSS